MPSKRSTAARRGLALALVPLGLAGAPLPTLATEIDGTWAGLTLCLGQRPVEVREVWRIQDGKAEVRQKNGLHYTALFDGKGQFEIAGQRADAEALSGTARLDGDVIATNYGGGIERCEGKLRRSR